MKKYLLVALAFFALNCFVIRAQDGSPDLSFGNNGVVRYDIDGGYDFPLSIVQQTDGKLVVAGSYTVNDLRFPSITRFLPDGTIDITFGDNGLARFGIGNYEDEYYDKILIQSDGKILAGGQFYSTDRPKYYIHRFLRDGSVDTDYGTNGEKILFSEWTSYADIILQENNSLLVLGSLLDNGSYSLVLKQLLPDGALDLSFANNGALTIVANSANGFNGKLGVTNDAKIMLITNYDGYGRLLRFNQNGASDESFGTDGSVSVLINTEYYSRGLALYSDGKIAVYSGDRSSGYRISRYLSNGDLDISFGSNGFVNPNIQDLRISKILAQENQRLLFFGSLLPSSDGGVGGYLYVNRYTIDGIIDSSFNFDSFPPLYYVFDMILQQDGKIVCLMTTPNKVGGEDIIMKRYNNNPLSITDFEKNKIKIFPNPSTGIFTVESNSISEKTNYQITDVTGKIISIGELNSNQNEIDLSTASNGIYFLKAGNSVFRLMKN